MTAALLQVGAMFGALVFAGAAVVVLGAILNSRGLTPPIPRRESQPPRLTLLSGPRPVESRGAPCPRPVAPGREHSLDFIDTWPGERPYRAHCTCGCISHPLESQAECRNWNVTHALQMVGTEEHIEAFAPRGIS